MAQMQAIATSDDVAEESLRDQLRHGSKGISVGGGEGHLGLDRRTWTRRAPRRQGTSGWNGLEGPSSDRLLAMQHQAHCVQPPPELCASDGISSGYHADMPSGNGEASNGGARGFVQPSNGTHREGHDEQDQRRLDISLEKKLKEEKNKSRTGSKAKAKPKNPPSSCDRYSSPPASLNSWENVSPSPVEHELSAVLTVGRAGEADDLVARKASSAEHSHESGRSLRGGADTGSLLHPLPVAMAHMVMQLATPMTGQLQNLAVEIALDDRDGLWEIARSSNSWLSACALEHWLTARRISFQSGFDIYKDDTWQRLRGLR